MALMMTYAPLPVPQWSCGRTFGGSLKAHWLLGSWATRPHHSHTHTPSTLSVLLRMITVISWKSLQCVLCGGFLQTEVGRNKKKKKTFCLCGSLCTTWAPKACWYLVDRSLCPAVPWVRPDGYLNIIHKEESEGKKKTLFWKQKQSLTARKALPCMYSTSCWWKYTAQL